MKKITQKTIFLIPDTNRLWTKEEAPPRITKTFSDAILSMDGHYVVKVRIPDIVVQELVAQRKRALRKQIENLTKAAECVELLTGAKPTVPDETFLAEQIEATFRRQIADLGYEVLETPVDHIPWRTVIAESVGRLPPFQNSDTEKGFKDAVLMYTVLHHAQKNGNEEDTYFIVHDKLLREATRSKSSKVGVFEDIEQFQGHLRLLEEEVDKDIALSLQAEAGEAFYSITTGKGFFVGEEIRPKILVEFSKNLDVLSEGSNYTRVGQVREVKSTTSFVSKVSKRLYEWKTEIEFASKFVQNLGDVKLKCVRISFVWRATLSGGVFSGFEFRSSTLEGEALSNVAIAARNDHMVYGKFFYGDSDGDVFFPAHSAKYNFEPKDWHAAIDFNLIDRYDEIFKAASFESALAYGEQARKSLERMADWASAPANKLREFREAVESQVEWAKKIATSHGATLSEEIAQQAEKFALLAEEPTRKFLELTEAYQNEIQKAQDALRDLRTSVSSVAPELANDIQKVPPIGGQQEQPKPAKDAQV